MKVYESFNIYIVIVVDSIYQPYHVQSSTQWLLATKEVRNQ